MEFKHLDKILKKYAVKIVRVLRQSVNSNTNNLRNSIDYHLSDNIVVIDMDSYGSDVDEGTKPHYVSPSHLMEWSKSKGLNPFAVAKNIAKFGTKAHPFLYKAEAIQQEADNEIKNAIFKDTEVFVDKAISKNKHLKVQ